MCKDERGTSVGAAMEMRLRECFAAVDRGEVGVWVRVPVDFPLAGQGKTLCDQTEVWVCLERGGREGRQLIRRTKDDEGTGLCKRGNKSK